MRVLTTSVLVTLCGCSIVSSFDDYMVVEDAGTVADAGPGRDVPQPDAIGTDDVLVTDVPGFDGGFDGGPPIDGGFDAGCREGAPNVCGTGCVDLQTDPSNCGSCGRECPATNVCIAGDCTGPEFETALPNATFRQHAFVRDVTVDSSGRIYATGFTDSDGDNTAGLSSRMFVAQFNGSTGTLNWLFFGDTSSLPDFGVEVEVVQDRLYVTGVTAGRMRVGLEGDGSGSFLDDTAADQLSIYVLHLDIADGGSLAASSAYDVGQVSQFNPVGGPRLAASETHVAIAFNCRTVAGDGLTAAVAGGADEDVFVVGFDPVTLDAQWSHQFDDQRTDALGLDSGFMGASSLLLDGDRLLVGIEQEAFTAIYNETRLTGPTSAVALLSAVPMATQRELGVEEIGNNITVPTSIALDAGALFVGGTQSAGTAIWRRMLAGGSAPTVTPVTESAGTSLRAMTVGGGLVNVALRVQRDTTFTLNDGSSLVHVVADDRTSGDAVLVRLVDGGIESVEAIAEGPFEDLVGGMVRVDDVVDVLGVNIQDMRDDGNMSLVRSLP